MKQTTQQRNSTIKQRVKKLLSNGYSFRRAFAITADEYFLSPRTVRDIWYNHLTNQS